VPIEKHKSYIIAKNNKEVYHMKKRILTLSIVLALVATMVMPMAALASNSAGQGASTFATTIGIVSKTGSDTDVANIYFPAADPGTTVSIPFNPDDPFESGIPYFQVLSDTVSEPVVKLKNTSAEEFMVWLSITGWENGVVTQERYELVAAGSTDVDAVTQTLSSDGSANTVPTSVNIAASGGYLDLYLEVDLINTAGVGGGSVLTILGSIP
jgi:ABC-type phosphate transport system substrate-binding protein